MKKDVFKQTDPKKIALSLKRSAERSHRRKAAPFRSAMSMLVFYINRAGRNLPKKQLAILERAKDELRAAFGKSAATAKSTSPRGGSASQARSRGPRKPGAPKAPAR